MYSLLICQYLPTDIQLKVDSKMSQHQYATQQRAPFCGPIIAHARYGIQNFQTFYVDPLRKGTTLSCKHPMQHGHSSSPNVEHRSAPMLFANNKSTLYCMKVFYFKSWRVK